MNSNNKISAMLSKLCSLIVLVLAGTFYWLWVEYQQLLTDEVVADKVVLIELERGDSLNRIIDKLIDHDLSINPLWFKLLAYQKQVANKLKAGEYRLEPGLTAPEILAVFVSGKTRQYSITIPEGWNFKEMMTAIGRNPQLSHTLQGLSQQEIIKLLNSEYQHPEGLFFPDTYHFEKNMSDLSLLQRSHKKMQTILAREWANRASGIAVKTPYQALILASIVEKETASADERTLIAGVFNRRIIRGMRLQTDPTVIYGMGDAYQGNIRSTDLETWTPYNTYMINGLPPTPIALPGKQAIQAVLHPAPGKSLYFVSRGDGRHVFSATLRDHNKAVNQFQRKKQ